MDFRKYFGIICLLLLPVIAGANPPTLNWEGLTGLFTEPTAAMQPKGTFALSYAELRFKQHDSNDENKLLDTWFTGSITYLPTSRLEIALTDRHEILDAGPLALADFPERFDDVFLMASVKYLLVPVGPHSTGLAIGAQDVTGATRHFNGSAFMRGRRLFLVGTYRWATLGSSYDDSQIGAFAGAQLEVTGNIDLLAEWSTRPRFAHFTPGPDNPINFNLGVRLHPREIPRLHVDLTAIGDGEFDFGFGLSYNLSP